MNCELIDIVDDNNSVIGRATRREAHVRGLWHRTAHVWVIIPRFGEDRKGALLFQRRSPAKDVAPGLLDVSVGGHLAAGEDVRAAACRELAEELGIHVADHHLRPLGLRQAAGIFGCACDREFQTVFGVEEAIPLSGYRVQAGEIAALIPVPVGLGLRLFAEEVDSLEVESFRVDPDGTAAPDVERIRRDDFVPSADRYFYRAFVMARRWLSREDHLVI